MSYASHECERGWDSLIQACHFELSEIDPSYQILQIKEKFGGLRYYFLPFISDEKKVKKMFSIANDYERLSWNICELCGNQGTLISINGWKKTRCSDHKER